MKECISELKEIFPEFQRICDNWLQNAMIHGHQQSKSEKKCLDKFAKIMKELGVLPN